MLSAHVNTIGNPLSSSSNVMLGSTSNPEGGIQLKSVRNSNTSCEDAGMASSTWSIC